MVSSTYIRHGFKMNAIWFCDDVRNAVGESGADFVFLHGVDTDPFRHSLSIKQETLVTDLTEPADVIFNRFVHGYKRQIRCAEKENIGYKVYTSEELLNNPATLREFQHEAEFVYRNKGLHNNYNEQAVMSYIRSRCLFLSKTYRNGTDLAKHITIADGRSARCMYSVSNFRSKALDPRLAGRANKLLHWADIRFFKANSYETYDWGGVSSTTQPNGVDTFKLGFGGVPRDYYNIVVGKSPVGRLAVFCRSLNKVSFFS